MKHIRKKYNNQIELTDDLEKEIKSAPSFEQIEVSELPATKKPGKEKDIILLLEAGVLVKAFHHFENKTNYFVPEPNPVLLYYDSAYSNYIKISEQKEKLLSVITNSIDESMEIIIYKYYSLVTGFAIFLFTAVDCFMNRIIPDDFICELPRKKGMEIFDKKRIERELQFNSKFNVIKMATSKDFKTQFPNKYYSLDRLRLFRNSIIHTKAKDDDRTPYEGIFKPALAFNYKEALIAAKDYINYFIPKFIEDCPCSNQW